jgi:hypothetical protein
MNRSEKSKESTRCEVHYVAKQLHGKQCRSRAVSELKGYHKLASQQYQLVTMQFGTCKVTRCSDQQPCGYNGYNSTKSLKLLWID